MNKQLSFQRTVADHIAREGAGTPPNGAVDDILTKAGQMRPMPRWLALIKEPPMRISSSVAVGSPMVRVAAIMIATLLLALMVAGAGIAGSRLLAADGTIVVAQDGNGDYTTITEAVEAAVDGDKVLVKPGTYTEAVVIDKDITLSGDGPRAEIIIHAPADGPRAETGSGPGGRGMEPYAVLLVDTEAELSGLTLQGEGAAVIASGGAPIVAELMLDGVGTAYRGGGGAAGNSIVVNGGSTAHLRGNTLIDGGPIGVFDLSEPLIEGNTLTGGPHMWGGFGDGTIIRGNTIDGSLVRGIYVGNPSSLTIDGNTITNPGQSGIDLVGGGSPIAIDNVISGSTMAGIALSGSGEATISGNEFTDNNMAISWSKASGLIEGNTVGSGAAGIVIGTGSPLVRDNVVKDVEGKGLAVGTRTSPTLTGNSSCDNGTNLSVANNATPEIGENDICPDEPADTSE
jgi:parallel beta-helix repeat protein